MTTLSKANGNLFNKILAFLNCHFVIRTDFNQQFGLILFLGTSKSHL